MPDTTNEMTQYNQMCVQNDIFPCVLLEWTLSRGWSDAKNEKTKDPAYARVKRHLTRCLKWTHDNWFRGAKRIRRAAILHPLEYVDPYLTA